MAKEIKLTKGQVAIVDDEDYELVSQCRWYAAWSVGGYTWYAKNSHEGPMHRFILKPPDGLLVDHKDRNGLNNRRSNLRVATTSQNAANSRLPRTNTSGYRGVHFKYGRWQVQIRVLGRFISGLGSYDNPQDAARAYDRAARLHFGEFARCNFE